MKKLFLLLATLVCITSSYSQRDNSRHAACRTIAQCGFNFINPHYPDATIQTLAFNYTKTGAVPKFHDVHYRAETCDTVAATYCEDDTSKP